MKHFLVSLPSQDSRTVTIFIRFLSKRNKALHESFTNRLDPIEFQRIKCRLSFKSDVTCCVQWANVKVNICHLKNDSTENDVSTGGGGGAGGGVGGYSTKFYTGRLRPEIQPLTLLYTIFERKGTPFVNILWTNSTPFTYLV